MSNGHLYDICLFCILSTLWDAGHYSSSLVDLDSWDGRNHHIPKFVLFTFQISLKGLIIDSYLSDTLYIGFVEMAQTSFVINTKSDKSTEEASMSCILYIFRQRKYDLHSSSEN